MSGALICEHAEVRDGGIICCSPCLRDRILASDWLAEHDERIRIEAYGRGLADPGSAWMQGNAERERAAEARALQEAADAVVDECSRSAESCFCGSAEWLHDRADRIEAQR